MIRSIEMILGLDPMNRFDALADPITTCFTDTLDLTPYRAVPSNIPLDERNPAGTAMNWDDRYWLEKTRELDWSHIDAPDPYWLNRIIWYSMHKGARPLSRPARRATRPGRGPGLRPSGMVRGGLELDVTDPLPRDCRSTARPGNEPRW